MIQRTKRTLAVGLAVLAFGAMAASPAAAGFNSSVEHTILDGNQVGSDLFAFNAGGVSCSEITYSGTGTSKTSSTVTLAPTYKGCNAFGFSGVTIDANGCGLILRSGLVNTADISCPGAPIEITGPNCMLTIGSQSSFSSVSYTNKGSAPKRDIEAQLELTGLKYTQHGKGVTPCTSGSFSNGTYQAKATISGTDTAGSQTDLWFEAPAEPPEIFHSSVEHTIFDGAQSSTHVFTFNWGTFGCTNITYSGTQSVNTFGKLSLQPSISGCKWFAGGLPFDTNGCYLVFQESKVDIYCPASPMEITLPGCSTTIGSQSLTAVAYTTKGVTPKRDVSVEFNLTNIEYSECGETRKNGVLKGGITVTGTDTSGNQVDFWKA